MKRSRLFSLPMFVLFVTVTANCYPQTIGKLFSKEEANILFGKVQESIVIKSQDLAELLSKTDNLIMFKLSNNELTILGDHRNVLLPSNKTVPEDFVVSVFSKSKVKDLLELGNCAEVSIENRSTTLTITSGFFTLDLSCLCPPMCGNIEFQVAVKDWKNIDSD